MQREAFACSGEDQGGALADRAELEKQIQRLKEAVAFRDEGAARARATRKAEAEELAAGREAMEASKSQAQIAWDQHEQKSTQLKSVQAELAETKAAL